MGRSHSVRRQQARSSPGALAELQAELHTQSGVGRSMRREIEREHGRLDAAGNLVKCEGRAVFDSREAALGCRDRLYALGAPRINIIEGCTRTEGETHIHLHITNRPRD